MKVIVVCPSCYKQVDEYESKDNNSTNVASVKFVKHSQMCGDCHLEYEYLK